jgi:hypothetical protein
MKTAAVFALVVTLLAPNSSSGVLGFLGVPRLFAQETPRIAEVRPGTPRNSEETRGTGGVEDLAWMAGHWGATIDGVEMEEVWLAPNGGVMLGMHRDVKKTKTFFEFLRIAATAEGIAYLAQPGGRPATPFLLTTVSPTRAVFANPTRLSPADHLHAGRRAPLRAGGRGGPAARVVVLVEEGALMGARARGR